MSDSAPERMPIEQHEHDIIIVSDLHLANGYSQRQGRFDQREDFFYDAAFRRFLHYLIEQGQQRQRPQRLILLGDLFEFLQTDNRPFDRNGLPDPSEPVYHDSEVQDFLHKRKPFNGLSTSPAASIWRLERIARGHPEWFKALGEFLQADQGHRIDITLGNHDIEMIWPEAQQRLVDIICAAVDDASVGARIHFYPWFIYEPGLFYAEHGHQYDSLNSFATQMRPTLPPQRSADGSIDWNAPGPQLIELPLGSFFVRYVFNALESRDSFADNIRPRSRYVVWTLRNRPVHALVTLFYQVRLLTRVLRKTSPLSEREHRQRREHYQQTLVRPYSQQTGLSPEQLVAIDNLAAIPSMNSRLKQAQQVLVEPLLPLLTLFAPLALVYQALRRVRSTVRALAAFCLGVVALLYRERNIFRPPAEPDNVLRDTARAIDTILRQGGGAGARFYVFGHTHHAEVFPLNDGDAEPRYINSGTWTPIIDPNAQLLRGVIQLNVVRILRLVDTYGLAELLQWDDAAGRLDRVPLI